MLHRTLGGISYTMTAIGQVRKFGAEIALL